MNVTPLDATESSNVDRVLVSVIYVAGLPDLMSDPRSGSLSTLQGYLAAHSSLGSGRDLPWLSRSPDHWSHFWSNYLGATKPIKRGALDAARAWQYVVPHELLPQTPLTMPHPGTAIARQLAYPTAAVTLVEMELSGSIPLANLASTVASVRDSNLWGRADEPANRSLDGILTDMAGEVFAAISGDQTQTLPELPANASESVLGVVAPAHGNLTPTDLELLDGTAPAASATPTASILASLAAFTPTGEFDPTKLLAASSVGPARAYVTSLGHALWNPQVLNRNEPADEKDRIGCLFRNHTELVAHIGALSPVVQWAAARVRDREGLNDEQARLVRAAAQRLTALHVGDRTKTYRSQIATLRIGPLQQDLTDAQRGV